MLHSSWCRPVNPDGALGCLACYEMHDIVPEITGTEISLSEVEMRGKRNFSAADANAIRAILRELRSADESSQKKLRNILRKKYEFYITDFDTSRRGFTEADFNSLLDKGVINVQEQADPPFLHQVPKMRVNDLPDGLTGVANLRSQGFDGFVTVADLRCGNRNSIPSVPGVYLVLRDCASCPEFRDVGTGGRFKGKDPNVPISKLGGEWVDGAMIVYIGQAGSKCKGTLKKRIDELIRFGQGNPVGHWGGRLIWQLQGEDRLLVCWKEVANDDPGECEKELIAAFKSAHGGKRPFANLRD